MKFKITVLLLPLLFLFACENNSNKFIIPNSKLPATNIKIKRYGKALFEIDTANFAKGLKKIKNDFPLFLAADLNDSNNVNQIYEFVSDTSLINLYNKSAEVYPNDEFLNNELNSFFKYIKYYFPNKKLPKVYSYISGLHYESPVWWQDTTCIIAIDLYLGGDFIPYFSLGLPQYKVKRFVPQSISVDLAKEFYNQNLIVKTPQKTLLDRMVAAGKILYFLDMVLPEKADSLKIGYTTQQLKWAEQNEENIWAFLIENDLLFSTNYQAQSKLLIDGPFTTGFSKKSPSRIGVWLGWEIVKEYMNNNENISFEQLLKEKDSQKILKLSAYKP